MGPRARSAQFCRMLLPATEARMAQASLSSLSGGPAPSSHAATVRASIAQGTRARSVPATLAWMKHWGFSSVQQWCAARPAGRLRAANPTPTPAPRPRPKPIQYDLVFDSDGARSRIEGMFAELGVPVTFTLLRCMGTVCVAGECAHACTCRRAAAALASGLISGTCSVEVARCRRHTAPCRVI